MANSECLLKSASKGELMFQEDRDATGGTAGFDVEFPDQECPLCCLKVNVSKTGRVGEVLLERQGAAPRYCFILSGFYFTQTKPAVDYPWARYTLLF